MTAAWLLYAATVAALLAAAAWAAEAALRACGRPGRWVWAAALLGSVVFPAAAWLGWLPWGRASPEAGPESALALLDLSPIVVDLTGSRVLGMLDRPLLLAWGAASALVLLVVAAAVLRLGRARAGWRREVVEGIPVLLSGDVGPAALGFLRGAIVIPEWALALDERLRRLMLVHEEEHLRAGDPRLALAALVGPVLMPWNPAVWWQCWRLRQAMELDCDARVLRREPDARGYGTLLLEVGRRRGAGPLVTAAFAEPRSFLERRIRMMGKSNPRRRLAQALAGGAVAMVLVIGACEAPEPTRAGGDAGARATVEAAAGDFQPFTPDLERPELTNRREVAAALQRSYPPLLRDAGIGGRVGVLFWIDERGKVVRYRIEESSGYPALDAAAGKVAEVMAFAPARKGGRPIPVFVQIPIVFAVSNP